MWRRGSGMLSKMVTPPSSLALSMTTSPKPSMRWKMVVLTVTSCMLRSGRLRVVSEEALVDLDLRVRERIFDEVAANVVIGREEQ